MMIWDWMRGLKVCPGIRLIQIKRIRRIAPMAHRFGTTKRAHHNGFVFLTKENDPAVRSLIGHQRIVPLLHLHLVNETCVNHFMLYWAFAGVVCFVENSATPFSGKLCLTYEPCKKRQESSPTYDKTSPVRNATAPAIGPFSPLLQ